MLHDVGDKQTLELAAKQDFVKKTVKSSNPVKVISELIWNALDADASKVIVTLNKNPLDGVEQIVVRDNGTGISPNRAIDAFKKIGGSWKSNKKLTKGKRALHGKEGKGRLHFHSVAELAEWVSTSKSNDVLEKIAIEINSNSLEKTKITKLPVEDRQTGTVVTLSNLAQVFDRLDQPEAVFQLSNIFAPYLTQYPNVEIIFNTKKLDPKTDIERQEIIPKFDVQAGDQTITVEKVELVLWKTVNDERKIYYGARPGVILDSQPANITAPGLSFSAYAYSEYFSEAHDKGLLGFDNLNEPILIKTFEEIRDRLGDRFRKIQADLSSGLIEEYKKKGIYPYKSEPTTASEKAEQEVFAVTARAATTYSKTFRNAGDSEKAMMLSLLKQSFVSNPDSIHKILSAVFNLPKNKQDDFAGLLEKTELANIVETAHFISERVATLEVLKKVVFDPDLRKHVKERGQLDKLVQSNTWLFGESFHITLHEVGLTRVMERVRAEKGKQTKKNTKVKTRRGKIGRVDSFLGRSIPHPNSEKREFLIVELKAPKIVISKKEVDQVLDYALALSKQPDYSGTDTLWSFFLIGTEYDDYVESQITQDNRPRGLIYANEGAAIWVKSWAEVIRACEGRINFIQDKLSLSITDEEINLRIEELTSKISS